MKRVLLPLMMLFAAGCPPTDGPGDPSRVDDILSLTGDEATGGQVYAGRCQSCHGADGSGEGVVGPSLVDHVPATSDEDILDIVLEGDGGMPSAADLDDQDLADLLAYMNSEWGG